jgi:hypothetical protein
MGSLVVERIRLSASSRQQELRRTADKEQAPTVEDAAHGDAYQFS